MGTEKKTHTIGGHEYELETFGARQGMAVLLTLTRFLGPALADVMGAGQDVEASLSRGLATFAATAKPADLDTLVDAFSGRTKLLLEATTKAGTRKVPTALAPILDDHFAGRYTDLIQWLVWCIQENFSGFFAGPPTELIASVAGLK